MKSHFDNVLFSVSLLAGVQAAQQEAGLTTSSIKFNGDSIQWKSMQLYIVCLRIQTTQLNKKTIYIISTQISVSGSNYLKNKVQLSINSACCQKRTWIVYHELNLYIIIMCCKNVCTIMCSFCSNFFFLASIIEPHICGFHFKFCWTHGCMTTILNCNILCMACSCSPHNILHYIYK